MSTCKPPPHELDAFEACAALSDRRRLAPSGGGKPGESPGGGKPGEYTRAPSRCPTGRRGSPAASPTKTCSARPTSERGWFDERALYV